MNIKLHFYLIFMSLILAVTLIEFGRAQHQQSSHHQQQQQRAISNSLPADVVSTTSKPTTVASFFEKIRSGEILRPTVKPTVTVAPSLVSTTELIPPLNLVEEDDGEDEDEDDEDDDDEDDDDDEEDEEDDDDEDDEEEDEEDNGPAVRVDEKNPNDKIVSDWFGNKIKLHNNSTILIRQNKARDLGLLTIKAIILGPLIGLTLKHALLRGLLWALAAYFTHVFFPTLLTSLGLGTGLVGFARQLQPNYAQMLLPHLNSLPRTLQNTLPPPIAKLTSQYSQILHPVIESIRKIPEGNCRYRAVCETASYLIKNTNTMSNSLQRFSATVYLNFGTEYSKAWLDGIVQSDCAIKYSQCQSSPLSMVAAKLSETLNHKV